MRCSSIPAARKAPIDGVGIWPSARALTSILLLALLHELRICTRPARSSTAWSDCCAFAAEYPAERAARLTGISIERIRDLADAIRTVKRATFFVSVGVSQGPFGTLCAVAIQALAYVTGNFDREGGLLFQPWSAALGTVVRFPRQPSRVGALYPECGWIAGWDSGRRDSHTGSGTHPRAHRDVRQPPDVDAG